MQLMLEAGFAWGAARLAGPRWRLWVVALCVLSALVFQFPNFRHLYNQVVYHSELDPNLELLKKQIAEPFVSHDDWQMTHTSKMAYRLALPLLARALHVSVLGLLLGQLVVGLLMYYCLLTVLAGLLHDRLTAALLALGLSCTYFGSAFSFDIYGYFDAVCYALLVFLLVVRQRSLVFVLCLFGSFIDERMLIASLLLVHWYGLRQYGWQAPSWRFLFTRPAWAVYASWLAWLLLRLWLMRATHMYVHRGLVGMEAFRLSLKLDLVGLGFVSGLKSFWLLPLLAATLLWYQRRRRQLALLLLCGTPVFLASFSVMDLTRSLSYGMPVIFSCLSLLAMHTSLAERRCLAAGLWFFAWLIPGYNVLGHIQYASPAYLMLLKLLLPFPG
jgi:hypothetical protein